MAEGEAQSQSKVDTSIRGRFSQVVKGIRNIGQPKDTRTEAQRLRDDTRAEEQRLRKELLEERARKAIAEHDAEFGTPAEREAKRAKHMADYEQNLKERFARYDAEDTRERNERVEKLREELNTLRGNKPEST